MHLRTGSTTGETGHWQNQKSPLLTLVFHLTRPFHYALLCPTTHCNPTVPMDRKDFHHSSLEARAFTRELEILGADEISQTIRRDRAIAHNDDPSFMSDLRSADRPADVGCKRDVSRASVFYGSGVRGHVSRHLLRERRRSNHRVYCHPPPMKGRAVTGDCASMSGPLGATVRGRPGIQTRPSLAATQIDGRDSRLSR